MSRHQFSTRKDTGMSAEADVMGWIVLYRHQRYNLVWSAWVVGSFFEELSRLSHLLPLPRTAAIAIGNCR